MQNRSGARLFALAAVAALLAAPAMDALAAEGALLEKTVDVPRDKAMPVDLTFQRTTLTTVETYNDPKPSDIDDAKATDPKDKTFLIVRFRYKSDDYVKHHVKLRAIILTEEGAIIGEAGRSATLDAGAKDDTVSFPMKIKTLDWPKAARMKVLASFLD